MTNFMGKGDLWLNSDPCNKAQEKGQTDGEFTGELHELVAEFFEVFDELKGKTADENT